MAGSVVVQVRYPESGHRRSYLYFGRGLSSAGTAVDLPARDLPLARAHQLRRTSRTTALVWIERAGQSARLPGVR